MPSRTTTTGPTAQPIAAKRFELPVFDFKFGSLTDGTNIPPPPKEEEPPRAKTPTKEEDSESKPAVNGNGKPAVTTAVEPAPAASPQTITKAGIKRPADDIPMSPASPTVSTHRPSSIRRLFSRNLLNTSYTNGEQENGDGTRPPSRSTTGDDKRSRRGSGWFRRLRGVDGDGGKRSSVVFEEVGNTKPQTPVTPQKPQTPAGPPPPMIPELRELEAKADLKDGSSFGTDLFKNIK